MIPTVRNASSLRPSASASVGCLAGVPAAGKKLPVPRGLPRGWELGLGTDWGPAGCETLTDVGQGNVLREESGGKVPLGVAYLKRVRGTGQIYPSVFPLQSKCCVNLLVFGRCFLSPSTGEGDRGTLPATSCIGRRER